MDSEENNIKSYWKKPARGRGWFFLLMPGRPVMLQTIVFPESLEKFGLFKEGVFVSSC